MESYKILHVDKAQQSITVEYAGYGLYTLPLPKDFKIAMLHDFCLGSFPLQHAQRIRELRDSPPDMAGIEELIKVPVAFAFEDAEKAVLAKHSLQDPIAIFADDSVTLVDVDLNLNMWKL